MSAGLRVPGRVVDQVREHLGQPNRICVDEDRLVGHDDDQLVPLALDQRAARLDGALDHRRQPDALLAERQLAVRDTGHIEKVVEQPGHVPDLPVDHLPGPLQLGVAQARHHEDLHGVVDRGQGIPELVGQGRQELVLAALDHRQLLGALAEPLLEEPALCDVTHDPGEIAALVQPEFAHGQVHRERRAVLAQPLDFPAAADDLRPARREIVGDVAVVRAPMRLRHERPDVAPDDLPGLVSEQALGRRVERLDGAHAVDGDDPVDHVFHDRAGPLLGLPQAFLRLLPFRDVQARADVPGEDRGRSMEGDAVVQQPAVFAVVASQPVLHRERLAGVEGAGVGREAAVEIVAVHVLGPAVAELLLQRATHEIQPRLVEPGAELVGAADPDHDRSGVRHVPEAPLVLDQGFLHLLALGDVAAGL